MAGATGGADIDGRAAMTHSGANDPQLTKTDASQSLIRRARLPASRSRTGVGVLLSRFALRGDQCRTGDEDHLVGPERPRRSSPSTASDAPHVPGPERFA